MHEDVCMRMCGKDVRMCGVCVSKVRCMCVCCVEVSDVSYKLHIL